MTNDQGTETTKESVAPDMKLHDALGAYIAKKKEKDDLEQKLDKIDEEMEPIKNTVIEIMQALDYQKISYDGTLYHLAVVSRPSVKPDTRAAFIAALEANKEDGIVQRDYINANTLWGWRNGLSDEDQELYSEYLTVSEQIQLRSPNDYQRKRKKR